MTCPVCGGELRPNKGWASMFYDGYCNTCDMPVEDGVADDEQEGDGYEQKSMESLRQSTQQ